MQEERLEVDKDWGERCHVLESSRADPCTKPRQQTRLWRWQSLTTVNTNSSISYSSRLCLPQPLQARSVSQGVWVYKHLPAPCGQAAAAPMPCTEGPSYFICSLVWSSAGSSWRAQRYLACQQAEQVDPAGASPVCGMGCECFFGARENSDRDKAGPAETRPRSSQAPKKKIWQACLLLFKLTTEEPPGVEENLEQFQHAHVPC